MRKEDILNLMREDSAGKTPDVFERITLSAQEQGLLNAGQAASLGAAHASAASAGGAVGAGAAAGGTKIIISSIIAALAVTAAVGGTVGASLAVNSANHPSSSTPPVIENPNPSENPDPSVVEETDGLEYLKLSNGNGYAVKGIGTVTAAEIVVPKTHNGETVTSINMRAFKNCTNVTKVTLPDTIENIGSNAFENCGITSITVPDSVKYIYEEAFSGCGNLESVTLPADLTRICEGTFAWCEKLTQISLPAKIAYIDESAFYDSGLTSIEFPASVVEIGDSAFNECKNLTSVSINSDMTVGSGAFAECKNLKDIDVADKEVLFGGTALYETAFERDFDNYQDYMLYIGRNLVGTWDYFGSAQDIFVIKPDTLTISSGAFSRAASCLTEIYIPSGVTRIGSGPFAGCRELESITVSSDNQRYYAENNCLIERETQTLLSGCKNSVMPNPYTSAHDPILHIGDAAFVGMEGLESITFYSGLQSIGREAFLLTGLKEVILPEGGYIQIGESAFQSCYKLERVVLGSGVFEISRYMFCDCNQLTSITVSGNLEKICDGAFSACDNFETIYYNGNTEDWGLMNIDGNSGLTAYTVVCNDGTLRFD